MCQLPRHRLQLRLQRRRPCTAADASRGLFLLRILRLRRLRDRLFVHRFGYFELKPSVAEQMSLLRRMG
jgi:hypothetical protein